MSSFCKRCGTWMSGDTCPSCNHVEKRETVVNDVPATTHCPGCGKRVDINSGFCPYCGKDVNVKEKAPGKETPAWENPKTAKDGKMHCPHCDELIDVKAAFCPLCGKDVRKQYHKITNCLHCGKALKDTATFCPSCGKKVVVEGTIKPKETPNVKIVRCIKCGKPFEENARFCSGCGTNKEVSEHKICAFCGKKLESGSAFCPSCGKSVKTPPGANGDNTYKKPAASLKKPHKVLALMERISAGLWFIIAGLQALIALILFLLSDLFGFLWIGWGLACVWNIICSVLSLMKAGRVERKEPGIVEEYRNSLVSNIIYIAYNIFACVFIGIICGVFNIICRSYALRHADELEDWGE